MIWNIIFYGIIIAVGITVVAVTIYRIDWARHPEKYANDLEELNNKEKKEYWKQKNAQKEAAVKKAKQKEKDARKEQRIAQINAIRAKNGKGPDAKKK